MTWFDLVILLLAVGLLIRGIRQEAGRGLMDAIATLVAVHFSRLTATGLTQTLGWRVVPGLGCSPLLLALCFAAFWGAGLGLSRLLHSQTRWSMDNFDFLFGIIFGLVVAFSVGHVATEVAEGFATRPDGTVPEYMQNSCVADELRSFHTYHYVINVFHSYQYGKD